MLISSPTRCASVSSVAAEVGERLGISRATAQRYLARLVVLERATVRPGYGKAGRPEHRYSLG